VVSWAFWNFELMSSISFVKLLNTMFSNIDFALSDLLFWGSNFIYVRLFIYVIYVRLFQRSQMHAPFILSIFSIYFRLDNLYCLVLNSLIFLLHKVCNLIKWNYSFLWLYFLFLAFPFCSLL
jgi:hypothetical protein